MNKIMFPLWLYLLSFFLSPSQSLLQLQFCQLFACLSFLELLQFCFWFDFASSEKLFLRENQFSYPKNWPKIKFPEKPQKIQNNIFLEKRGREAPEVTQGGTSGHHTYGRHDLPGGGAWGYWPTQAPPGRLLKAIFFLSPEKHRKT